jgi:hypothetical protein
MSDQTSNATFLGVPREIRDGVYTHVLNPVVSTCIKHPDKQCCNLKIDEDSMLKAEQSLLLTNRQINTEVTHASDVLNVRPSPRFIHISTHSFECAHDFIDRHPGISPHVKSINFTIKGVSRGKVYEKWPKSAWQWYAVGRLRSSLASHTGRIIAVVDEVQRIEDDPAIDIIVRGSLVADDGPIPQRYQTKATSDEEE